MYCPNCGKQELNNGNFCGGCGYNLNNPNIIKPIVTNVGYDDTLPKNSNFAFALIILAFIVISSLIFLKSYKEKYDYTQYVSLTNGSRTYNIYIPVGYASKIEEKDNVKSLFIYNDDLSYVFQISKNDYDSYIKQDNALLKAELKDTDHKFDSNDIKNDTYKNNRVTSVKLKNEGIPYLFLYELDDTYDQLAVAYIYSDNNIKQEDIDVLYEILDRIKKRS